MKNIARLLLCLFLLCTGLLFVGCNEEPLPPPELSYTLNSAGTAYTVSGMGTYTGGDIEVPSTVNGVPVTAVAEGAFQNQRGITGIALPDSISVIGKNAFSGCAGMTSLRMGDNVIFIGDYAFHGCNAIRSATIPVIALEKIYSGELTALTVNGGEEISYMLLGACEELTEVTIGASVTSIEANAFASCRKLASITVAEGNSVYSSLDGHLYSKDRTVLMRYAPAATETAFTVPASVTRIETQAFRASSLLTEVVIPDSVTHIGSAAFSACTALTEVTFGSGLQVIGASAFSACTSITYFDIPAAVHTIGDYAFFDCTSLQNIWVAYDNNAFASADGVLYNKDATKLVQYPVARTETQFEVPDGVAEIGRAAFYHCDALLEVSFPDTLTRIGVQAFSECSELRSVSIPAAVKSIGISAFYLCENLESVVFEVSFGWYLLDNDAGTSGTPISISTPAVNARNISYSYRIYYWKHN